jgi:hypothetical protein
MRKARKLGVNPGAEGFAIFFVQFRAGGINGGEGVPNMSGKYLRRFPAKPGVAIHIAAGFCATSIFAIIFFVIGFFVFFQRAEPNAPGSVYYKELWKKRFDFRPQADFKFGA